MVAVHAKKGKSRGIIILHPFHALNRLQSDPNKILIPRN